MSTKTILKIYLPDNGLAFNLLSVLNYWEFQIKYFLLISKNPIVRIILQQISFDNTDFFQIYDILKWQKYY